MTSCIWLMFQRVLWLHFYLYQQNRQRKIYLDKIIHSYSFKMCHMFLDMAGWWEHPCFWRANEWHKIYEKSHCKWFTIQSFLWRYLTRMVICSSKGTWFILSNHNIRSSKILALQPWTFVCQQRIKNKCIKQVPFMHSNRWTNQPSERGWDQSQVLPLELPHETRLRSDVFSGYGRRSSSEALMSIFQTSLVLGASITELLRNYGI